MKKFVLLSLLGSLFLSEAFASGGTVCDLEATVKQIHVTGILDDTVSLSHSTQEDTYKYVAIINVTSSTTTGGYGECSLGEQLITLKDSKQVKAGDLLRLEFISHHDRPCSSMTYKLK